MGSSTGSFLKGTQALGLKTGSALKMVGPSAFSLIALDFYFLASFTSHATLRWLLTYLIPKNTTVY